MSKISALVLTSFLTTACITQSVASGLFEEQEKTKSYNLGSHDPNPFELTHFSGAEGTHIWTSATECLLSMPVIDGAARLKHVQFTVNALANGSHPQRLEVFLNDDRVIVEREFKSMIPSELLDIDIPAVLTEKAIFRFLIPDACLPQVIDPTNMDGRTLGFSFSNVTLTYSETIEITEDEVSKKDIMNAAAKIALHETEKSLNAAAKKVEKEVVNFAESAEQKLEREVPKTIESIERRAPEVTDKVVKEVKKSVKSLGKKGKKLKL